MPYGGRQTSNAGLLDGLDSTDFVQAADIVTTVSDPGADTKVPSEQAVREALSGADEKARVSANDTTPGYLHGKLTAGTGITLTENNDAGDETLSVSANAASALAAGIVQLATMDEINTGTETARAITPAGLQTSNRNLRYLVWRCVAAGTACVGDPNTPLEMAPCPITGTIVSAVADNDTAGSDLGNAASSYDIFYEGTTIFTTALSIDSGDDSSRDATSAAEFSANTAVAAGGRFTLFCTAVGDTAPLGLVFTIGIRET